jgi:signal transduction histidine kinase
VTIAYYIPLFGAIINLPLAVFVFVQNPRSTMNRLCAAFGLGVSIWNFGSYRVFLCHSPDEALFWVRFLHFGLIFGPALLLHLALVISGVKAPRAIRLLYAHNALIALSNFTPAFISGVRHLGRSGYYGIAGPAYFMWSPFFLFMFLAIGIMWRQRRHVSPLYRARMDSMIWAFGLLVIGSNDVLPILGVERYPFTAITIYPFGSLAALVFGFLLAYSVLQHQLLDVRVALSRVAAHGVRLLFLVGAGMILLFLIELLMPRWIDGPTFVVSLAVLLASGLLATLFFPKLFGSGNDSLEQRMLGDHFEYHDRIRQFISTSRWYTDMDQLMEELNSVFLQAIGVKGYRVILMDEGKGEFRQIAGFPEALERRVLLPEDSPLIRYFRSTGAYHLGIRASTGIGDAGRAAVRILREMEGEICMPFLFGDEVFGLLALGEKRSLDPFTATDVRLLGDLVTNLGMTINQIQLKNQVLRAEELELLGRMSRGMAHDLNNLLTPIWATVQLVSEGVTKSDLEEDLLPVAMRNVRAIRAYIQDALFFSEQLRPNFCRVPLKPVIEQAVDMTVARIKRKRLVPAIDVDPAIEAEIDEVLVQRMLANLLSNAADASPEGGEIRVVVDRFLRGDPLRTWVRFSVIDQGPGISKENSSKVLRAYFTTKIRGDEGRGFGLGLAICRRIVAVHGGTLDLSSSGRGGTVASVEIPERQPVDSNADNLGEVMVG